MNLVNIDERPKKSDHHQKTIWTSDYIHLVFEIIDFDNYTIRRDFKFVSVMMKLKWLINWNENSECDII